MPVSPPRIRALLAAGVLSAGFFVGLAGCGDGSSASAAAAGSSGSGGSGGSDYDWGLPPGYPKPKNPADNPMSETKAELGRRLFYDKRLSGNQTFSCASCHRQDLAFTDARAQALGSTGESHSRGSMGLVNVAYLSVLTWANPLIQSLEQQAMLPMFGETPVELGLAGKETELLDRLRAEPIYEQLFPAAFPEEAQDPFTLSHIVRAIGAFERTLLSYRSPYDRYAYGGDPSGLSQAAIRGRDLFFSEKLECFHCHGGFNFSDSVTHDGSALTEVMFHNTGLYNIDGNGAYPPDNTGVLAITGTASDMGRFRAPTLRNIAVTAPYMHDGSVATLSDALDHYAAGGRTIASGPYAGVGSTNPFKSELIAPFDLSAAEKADVIEFLHSLTDQEFLTDPRYSDPWGNQP